MIKNRRDDLEETDRNVHKCDKQIAELSKRLKSKHSLDEHTLPLLKSSYRPVQGDILDEMLGKYINNSGCPVPIKKLGDGYYLFGTRKIYAKILNGKLVIRVGGGFMVIEEFISTYAEKELVKMDQQAGKTMELQQSKSTLRMSRKEGSPVNVQRAQTAPASDVIYHSQPSP